MNTSQPRDTELEEIAQILDSAAVSAKATKQLSAGANRINLDQAYQIQKLLIKKRTDRGEKIIGVKMGFTSREKMLQMGVDDLVLGQLTDAMVVDNGGSISLSHFVHPRIEPELAFLLNRPLAGKVKPREVMQAVEAIAPAMEIIDSRYKDFKFSIEDVIADNTSSSALVYGDWQSAPRDIGNLGMVMSFNGQPIATGSSAAILTNPYLSLVHAARLAAAIDRPLQAGWVVMAGAATAAWPLQAGMRAETEVQHLGRVSLVVEET